MTGPGLMLSRVASLAGWKDLRSAAARWDFGVCNGRLHVVSAKLENEAIELSAGPLERSMTRWDLLRANRGLPPPARLVLTWRDELQLRCEVLLDDGASGEIFESAVDSITAGLDAAPAQPDADEPAEEWDAEGAAVEAGLAGRRLADGRFRLEAGSATPRTATLGPGPVARVKMLPAGEYSATVREAVATLLLRVTSGVRFARAAASREGSAWFEVRFAAPPCAAELRAAVSALALAARCTDELAVLTREETASTYLAAGGESGQKGGDRSCQSLPPM